MSVEVGNFLVGKINTSVVLRVLSLRKNGVLVRMLDSSMETYAIGSEFLVKNEHLKAYQVIGFSKEDLNTEYVKGKTEGYNEGYQHGFTIAKEKITELDEKESKNIYNDGYVKGHNAGWRGAVKAYEFGTADKEYEKKLDEEQREGFDNGYNEGYNTAIKEMKSDESSGEGISCLFASECDSNVGYKRETYPVTEGVDIIDYIKNNFDNIKSFAQVGDVGSIEFFDKRNSSRNEQLEKELELVEKYPHYYKDIRHLNIIDIYRFFDLFEVTDPCIQHSMKKLAVGGKRGAKDYEKDIREAMDTLKRWEYMQEENKRGLYD